MNKTTTLIYKLNDLESPSETLYNFTERPGVKDEVLLSLLNILEVDPGIGLVKDTISRFKNI